MGNVRICVVGSANVDLTVRAQRLPQSGETLIGEDCHIGFGGKGANQTVMAARLGASVTMVARVGDDLFGTQIVDHLRASGIDTSQVSVCQNQSTGMAVIMVDALAQNSIVVVPGANGALSPEDIRNAAPAIERADVLLCQLETPAESSVEAFRIARNAGVRTILNPAPALPISDDLLRVCDLCIPNQVELEMMTGLTAGTLEEVFAAGRQLLQRGPRAVIVTLAAEGAMLIDPMNRAHFPARRVQAIDTTGAGDAFIGSLAVFLAESHPLAGAIRRANGAAALSVTRKGTQASFPTRQEVEQLDRS